MNSEHLEYNRDTNPYPSFGKKYNGEKAIISLTSWRARINTVSKTLFSLLKQCPGFHIVLVLSEEEFPKMMDELPENLKVFAENELIEILWVYKNYRSFKKWIFTSKKYPNVPIISADDDCIYTCNYAQMFYNEWLKNKNCCISNTTHISHNYSFPNGYATLYIPNLGDLIYKKLNDKILNTNNDDAFIGIFLYKIKTQIKYINKSIAHFHDEISAMGTTGMYIGGVYAINLMKTLL